MARKKMKMGISGGEGVVKGKSNPAFILPVDHTKVTSIYDPIFTIYAPEYNTLKGNCDILFTVEFYDDYRVYNAKRQIKVSFWKTIIEGGANAKPINAKPVNPKPVNPKPINENASNAANAANANNITLDIKSIIDKTGGTPNEDKIEIMEEIAYMLIPMDEEFYTSYNTYINTITKENAKNAQTREEEPLQPLPFSIIFPPNIIKLLKGVMTEPKHLENLEVNVIIINEEKKYNNITLFPSESSLYC